MGNDFQENMESDGRDWEKLGPDAPCGAQHIRERVGGGRDGEKE